MYRWLKSSLSTRNHGSFSAEPAGSQSVLLIGSYPTPNTTLTTQSRTHLPPCLLACWWILQIWCHLWSWWGCIPLFKTIMQSLNSIILRTNPWRSFNWLLATHRNVDHCFQILIILLLIHLSLQLHLIQTFQGCWGDVVKDKENNMPLWLAFSYLNPLSCPFWTQVWHLLFPGP